MPIASEITAVAKILNRDFEAEYIEEFEQWERDRDVYMESWHAPLLFELRAEPKRLSPKDLAKIILLAAEASREKMAKYISVGRIHLPDGQFHNFAVGPFSTLLQAQRAGEGFSHDPKTGTGAGVHRAVPLVAKPADAWNAIRPEHVDVKDWIAHQIRTTLTGLSDPNVYKERGKW